MISLQEALDLVESKLHPTGGRGKRKLLQYGRTLVQASVEVPLPISELCTRPTPSPKTALSSIACVIERGFYPDIVPVGADATLHIFGNRVIGGGAAHDAFAQEEKLTFEFPSTYYGIDGSKMCGSNSTFVWRNVPHIFDVQSFGGRNTFSPNTRPEDILTLSKFPATQLFTLVSTDFPNLKHNTPKGSYTPQDLKYLEDRCFTTAAVANTTSAHFYTGQPGCGDFCGNLPLTIFFMCLGFAACDSQTTIHWCMPTHQQHAAGAALYENDEHLIKGILDWFANIQPGTTIEQAKEQWLLKLVPSSQPSQPLQPSQECSYGKGCGAVSCVKAHTNLRNPAACRCSKRLCTKTHAARQNTLCMYGDSCILHTSDRCEYKHQ
jgi:hypothetical protein